MNQDPTNSQKLKALQDALEIYGSDLNKMPKAQAAQIKTFVSQNSQAQELYQQAVALDAVLDRHHIPETAHQEVQARIMAALDKDETATVIEFSPKPNKAPVTRLKAQHEGAANENQPASLLASGLLAASLMLGMVFGALGQAPTTFFINTTLTMASNEASDNLWGLTPDDQFERVFFPQTSNEGSQ